MDKYQIISRPDIRDTFEDYIASVNIPFIDYFAIGIQDVVHRESASLMSRVEWQHTFKALEFATHDPVRIAALDSRRFFFSFDELDHIDKLGNKIMLERKRYAIRNGIVLMQRTSAYNYMLTLATDSRKFTGNEFFLKHHASVKHVFKDLIQLVHPMLKIMLPNCPVFDAK